MTLIGQDLSGSGFHFSVGGQNFIACSLHQFDGETPTEMINMEIDAPIAVTGSVYRQNDVQILSYDNQALAEYDPLHYQPDAQATVGTPVYVYHFDEPYKGRVFRVTSGKSESMIIMEDPYPAAGNSGSPVVSGLTGNVIGVVLSANDHEAATTVGFEPMTWPGPETID